MPTPQAASYISGLLHQRSITSLAHYIPLLYSFRKCVMLNESHLDPGEHAGVDVVRADDGRPDGVAVALHEQLHPQRLVQPHRRELGGAVVDQLVGAAVARQARHVDQVAALLADHVGEEGLDRPEVRHDVHVEGSDDPLIAGVEQRGPVHDARVVDKNGDDPDLGLCLLGCLVDRFSDNKDNYYYTNNNVLSASLGKLIRLL